MGLQLSCPHGHRWEEPAVRSGDTQRICPKCGAAPLAHFAPPIASDPAAATRVAPAIQVVVAATIPRPNVPGYQILGELGRGGMGIVYKAQHLALKRLVALKMVNSGAGPGSTELARFRAEAEAVARLQHPGIVQIYEVGEHDGRPYCALEYVAGGSLAQHLAGKPLIPAVAAKLVADLAEGVQHAHDNGIIHRDLKPANILLSGERRVESGELITSGLSALRSPLSAPKITDFGLAKTLDTPDGPTKSGTILGTPSYMAPEQALGDNRTIGPATDVYSLGAILYECLTGRPPFKAENSLDTMLLVASEDPVPPRQINRQVPRDLETICLKCLRKASAKRYASARELAEDLSRFLRHEPIRARPVGTVERSIKWMKRRPAWTAALVLLVLVPSLTGAIVWKVRRSDPIPKTVVIDAGELERYAKLIVQADQDCREGKFAQAEQTLSECSLPSRQWEWHYLHRLCNWGTQRRLTGFGGPVVQVAYGKRNRLAVAAESPGVQIRDAETGRLLFQLGEKYGPVSAMALSPDSGRLATVGTDAFLRLYDLPSRREIACRKHDGPLSCVAFSPDGKWLVVGGGPGVGAAAVLSLWNAEPKEQPHRRYTGHRTKVISVAFDPTSRWFASLAETGDSLKQWSIDQDKWLAESPNFNLARPLFFVPPSPMARQSMVGVLVKNKSNSVGFFMPPNPFMVSDWADPLIREGKVKFVFGEGQRYHDQPDLRTGNGILDAAYNSDHSMLALAGGWSNQGKVRLFRGQNLNSSIVFFGHGKPIQSLAFAPDRLSFATGSSDGTVRIWDPNIRLFDAPLGLPSAAPPAVQPGSSGQSSVFSRGGRYLAVAEPNPAGAPVVIWNVHTGQKTSCQGTAREPIQSLCFHGDHLAGLSGRGMERAIHFWEASSGKPVATKLDGARIAIGALAACRDGIRLAQADLKGIGPHGKGTPGIRLIDPLSGQIIRVLGAESFWKLPLVFSPDGERLTAVSSEGSLALFDIATGQLVLTSAVQPGMDRFFFRGNGRYLIHPTEKQGPEIWDAKSGKAGNPRWPSHPWHDLAEFSPDGRLLALPIKSKENQTFPVLLWNGVTGKEIKMLRGHGSGVVSLVFSADNRRLFTAAQDDAVIKVWDTATGLEISSLRMPNGKGGQLLLSPDGMRLGCQEPRGIHVWDATPVPPEAAAK